MTRPTSGSGNKPAAARASETKNHAKPLVGSSSGISAFIERIKPYQDLITMVVAVITLAAGGVFWIVGHFATQDQARYLECRVDNSTMTRLLNIRQEEFAIRSEWRSSQIKELALHGSGASQNLIIADLSDQLTALTKEQDAAFKKFQEEIDEATKRCISDSPKRDKTQETSK